MKVEELNYRQDVMNLLWDKYNGDARSAYKKLDAKLKSYKYLVGVQGETPELMAEISEHEGILNVLKEIIDGVWPPRRNF
jgi:hypothetical protein